MKKSTKSKNALLVVLISASATVLVGFFQFVLPLLSAKTANDNSKTPTDITRPFVGSVADEQTGKLIHGAKVRLEGKALLSPVTYTDSEGRFSFRITPDLNQIKIIVDAAGYKTFERWINPSGKEEPEDIRLTVADPSPTPVEPVKQPRGDPFEEKKKRALQDLNSNGSKSKPN